ncbi:hypothetical protein ACSBR1_025286 [Camellia fascicularis]
MIISSERLVEFTVFLHLNPTHKREVEELKNLVKKFKINWDRSTLYVHAKLRSLLKSLPTETSTIEREGLDDARMDYILAKLDIKEGLKAKFFLNLLGLCESDGDNVLVFSHYLQLLKFFERLAVKIKGSTLGKELFVIIGDSSSEIREWSIDCFNTSRVGRFLFRSVKACGERISLYKI